MKNKLLISSLAFIFFLGCKSSQTTTTKSSSDKADKTSAVIETIGKNPVYTADFAYVYKKNNTNASDAWTLSSIKDYLDLYTNFRLKVREAEEMGLDTSAAFKQELEGYRKQLAQPYLSEKKVTDSIVRIEYDRMKEEIKASHILIMCKPDADPKDTIAAYNKLLELRKRIVAGEDFDKVAKGNSDDRAVSLGYFTALQMVYQFEDVAYATKVGDVSMPFRTQFGYHLLKVYDRRLSKGEFKVAHIMVRATAGMNPEDSIAAKQKIDEIYNRLIQGENWDQMVTQFSDDPGSKNKGGELQWLSATKTIPAFADAALALQPGEISKPVYTPYGWHIIKFIDKKPLATYQEKEAEIRSKVSKDSRSELNKTLLIQRIKKENTFTENAKASELVVKMADSTLSRGIWKYNSSPEKDKITLFSIGKNKYTMSEFGKYVEKQQYKRSDISTQQYMRILYTSFQNYTLIKYEEDHLEDKYVDYKMLVKEYRDGILLFQLMDQKVWSKAIEDTAGLKAFFSKNQANYKWDTRAHATVFNCANQTTVDKLKTELAKGKYEVKEPALDKLFFSPNNASLTAEDKQKLDKTAVLLSRNKDFVVELAGSADLKETTSASMKRIDSAKAYLIMKGIKAERILSKDLGKTSSKGKIDKDKALERYVSFNLYSTNKKILESQFNQGAPLTLQYTEGTYQKGENEILNTADWKEGTYTINKDGRIYYIIITQIDAPRPKTFEESRGLVISDYQGYLEKEWITVLKQKYPVTVNDAEIQKLATTTKQ